MIHALSRCTVTFSPACRPVDRRLYPASGVAYAHWSLRRAGSTKSRDKLWRNLNDETSEPVRQIAYVLTTCIGGKYLIKTSGLRCDWDAYNSMPHCLLSRGSHPHRARGTRRKMTLSQLCKMCVNCVLVAILSFAHAENVV